MLIKSRQETLVFLDHIWLKINPSLVAFLKLIYT